MPEEVPMGEDISKAREAVLEEIKALNHIDKAENADVIFTNAKQGLFTMQVKFWAEVGFDFGKLRSEAIVKINDRLARERISLVTPTNISITQNAAANEPDKAE